MKRIILVCGIISGLIVSIVLAVNMIICYKNPEVLLGTGSMVIGYLSMLISFSLIYVGIKNFRDKHNNGYISFGKAFSIGFLIALLGSTFYVVVWAIMYHFYVPDFLDHYTAFMMKQAEATSTPAELQAKAAELAQYKEWYKSPLYFTLMTYAEILPVGLLVTLISALILKRRGSKAAVLAT